MLQELVPRLREWPLKLLGMKSILLWSALDPMTWTWLTPDKPVPGGFRAFDETEIEGEDAPETEGDILLYFSSDHADLNRIIADQVRELFGKDGELAEEVSAGKF